MSRAVTLHVRANEGAWLVERDGAPSCTFGRCDAAVTYACELASHLSCLWDRPSVRVLLTNVRGREYRVR